MQIYRFFYLFHVITLWFIILSPSLSLVGTECQAEMAKRKELPSFTIFNSMRCKDVLHRRFKEKE